MLQSCRYCSIRTVEDTLFPILHLCHLPTHIFQEHPFFVGELSLRQIPIPKAVKHFPAKRMQAASHTHVHICNYAVHGSLKSLPRGLV